MFTMYQTMQDFKEQPVDIAVVPVGALEQHGSHLPVGTDNLIATAFAEKMAEKLNAYLLPCLGITSSIEHRQGAGTVYLKADTLAAIIRDVADSLRGSGYKRLILINGHGGNWILKPTIRQINRDMAPFEVVLIHTGCANHRRHEVMENVKNDLHAGEMETSLILHLNEEYVKNIHIPDHREFYPQDFMDYFDNLELTEDGYWGYPEAATKEKGEKMLDLLVESGLAYLDQIDALKKKLDRSSQ